MKSTIAKAKRLMALLAVCTAAVAAGCAGPEIEERSLSPETFTATIEQEGATKTVLDAKTGSTRQVRWQDGDKIALYGASADYTMAGLVSTGSTAAYFTGSGATKDGGKYKAYYPASIYNSTTGKLTFREEQAYGGLSGGKAVVSNLPMYAESATTELDFKNLCSVLNFQLTGEATDKVTEIVVTTSAAGQYLSGEFTVGGTASAPTMVMTGASGSTASVTLDCTGAPGGGVALSSTPTDFFVAIPAQTYAAGTLTIKVKDEAKTLATLTNSTAATTLQRNTIYEIGKQAKAPVFKVRYNTSPYISSDGSGTPASGGTITLTDGKAVGLPFSVTTSMGYTVVVSDESRVIGTLPAGSGTLDDRSAPVTLIANVTDFGGSNFTEAEFTVSATKKVKFSPGSLQYQASTNTWRFASHQWAIVALGLVADNGEACNNDLASATYAGWFDTFCFGNTGINYRSGKHYYQPWLRGDWSDPVEETIGSQKTYASYYYGPENGPFPSQADWGTNAIYFGSDLIPAETYHMISQAEMNYILGAQPSGQPGGRYPAEQYRYLHATLPGGSTRTLTITFKAEEDDSYAVTYTVEQPGQSVDGALLFPDGFYANHMTLASRYGSFMNPTNASQRATLTNWPELEAAGCVFLPNGSYWILPASLYVSDGMRYGQSQGMGNLSYTNYRRNTTRLVRLVKDVTP